MVTPSIETRIYQAIKARAASLPMVSTYPVKWTDGPAYSPEATDRYLRATWTPNATQRQFIGSKDPHRRPGVLQIDVFGLVTQGSASAVEVAGQVAEHFKPDATLRFLGTGVRVMKAPDVGPVFVGTHVQVPVVVQLEALDN